MSFVVPELRLFWAEEQAKKQREREQREEREKQRHRKPIIPEGQADRTNAKEEGREMKRRPGGAARIAVILVTILPALVGAAGGTAAGDGVFADARHECRTAFEIELHQHAGLRDGVVEADDGLRPKRTITPPPHPLGSVTFALPRRGPADVHFERIATCLRALSRSLGAQQLFNLEILRGLEAQMQAIRQELAELKRKR